MGTAHRLIITEPGWDAYDSFFILYTSLNLHHKMFKDIQCKNTIEFSWTKEYEQASVLSFHLNIFLN